MPAGVPSEYQPIEVKEAKKNVPQKENNADRLEVLKTRALENLDKRGGLITIEEDKTGKRVLVFENSVFESESKEVVSRISGKTKKRRLSDEIKSACDPLYKSNEYGKNSVDRVLYLLFEGEKVVSRDEFKKIKEEKGDAWTAKDLPRKSFFYVPKDANEAFDTKKIRKRNDFYYIYGRQSQKRDEYYPTKELGLESGLKLPEVILPMIIYGVYGGERDKDGKLWVNSLTEGEQELELVSSVWLSKTAKYRIDMYQRNSIKPRDYLDKMCPQLLESGLLRKADFSEKEQAGIVSKNGLVTLDGVREYVGTKLAGLRYSFDTNSGVFRVTDREGVVVEKWIKAKKRSAKVTGKNSAYQKKQKEGIVTRSEIETMEGKTRTIKIDILTELPRLEELKSNLAKMGIPRDVFSDYSQEQQLCISNLINGLDKKSQAGYKKLILDHGSSFLSLFADIASFGKQDERLLKLLNLDFKSSSELLSKYSVANSAIDNLAESLAGELKDVTSEILVDRLSKALKVKTSELIIAQLEGHDVMGQFELMNDALGAFVDIYQKSPEYEMLKTWNKNLKARKSREVTSVTAVYVGREQKESERVKITFRPNPILKDGEVIAQARMSVVFQNPEGKEFKFRLDLDSQRFGGASLDIGDTEGIIGKALNGIGSHHHIASQFEKAFTNQEVFASIIKNWSKKLGFDFAKRSK